MKELKLFMTIAFVLIVTQGAIGQDIENSSCGLSFTHEEVRELYDKFPQFRQEYVDAESFVENFLTPVSRTTTSRQLSQGLRKAGFDVPDDYFDLVENQKINESFADHAVSEKINQTSNNNTIYYHNVWITVYRSNTIGLITNDAIYESMAQLNHAFATNNVPIRFHVKQINRVNNSNSTIDPSPTDMVVMAATNRDPLNRSLHLHIVDDMRAVGISGIAPVPMYHTTFMDNEHMQGARNWTTVVHEFGHVLGLFHTHQGKSITGYSWISNFDLNNEDMSKCRQEPVSRSKKQGLFCSNTGTKKCRVNGDQFCDTQASPRFGNANYNDLSCNYTGISNDKWNDRWRPQNTNYMSYAGACRSRFTAEQVAYMVGTGQPDSWAITADPAYSVSGPSQPCALNTYTFSVSGTMPSGVTRYDWVLPSGWSIVGAEHGSSIQVYINVNANSGQVVAMPNGLNALPVSKYAAVKYMQLYTDFSGLTKCPGSLYWLNTSEAASWSFSNPGWTIINGQNTSSITYLAGAGVNDITATSTACGRSVSQTYLGSAFDCGSGGPVIQGASEDDTEKVLEEVQLPNEHVIIAYPNPSKGDFKLMLEDEKLHKVTIIHGNQVFNQFYTRESDVNLHLPNNNIPYIVVIETEGSSKTVKLISK